MVQEGSATPYDVASRCPKCDMPGDLHNKIPAKPGTAASGTTIHLFYCRNDQCRWGQDEVSWIVQVNPDGTVPPANTGRSREKAFPTLKGPDGEEMRVLRTIEKQLKAETQPGSEVKKRG
jgi:hypothetical protein